MTDAKTFILKLKCHSEKNSKDINGEIDCIMDQKLLLELNIVRM